jgi:hypothetical protein
MSNIRRENQARRLDKAENPRKPWIDGGVIVLGIASGIGTAYHLSKIEWAIPFGVVCLACMTFLGGEIPPIRRIRTLPRILLQIAFVVAVVVFSYSPVRAEYKKQHAALTSGIVKLESSIWRCPRVPKGTATKPMLEIGDTGYMIDMSKIGDDQGVRLLQDEHLKIEVKDGVILVSTIIRDRDDKVLVKIEQNNWLASSPPLTFDKNYTGDTLEVKDARDRVVFHMRLLPDRVQVEGEWRDDTGYGVRIAKPDRGMPPGGMGIAFLQPRSKDPKGIADAFGRIQPMFKYPSSEHWGEFVTQP